MAASDILIYLPNSLKTRDEQEYLKFLIESYESNYEKGKYQFAFIAFHLLFMSYCYFQIWKIYNSNSEDFKKCLLGFEKLDTIFQDLEEKNKKNRTENRPIEHFYPFSFSEINERTIMIFFKLIECDKSKIGKYKKIVDDRNEIAHANGKMVFVVDRDLNAKIDDIMLLVEEIFNHSRKTLNSFFKNYLLSSSVPENREYIDDSEQIRETLINGNYLSQTDIEHLLTFDITQLSGDPNYAAMQQLFNTFQVEYRVT
jgi:hypothetical protein